MRMNAVRMGTWGLVLSLFSCLLVRADDTPPAKPGPDALAAIASSLKWQTGPITIKDGLARLNLTDDFRYLDAENSRKVLHDIWGNPDDPGILGMIFPRDKGPLDHGSWAVTVSYEEQGYVKDDDADKINYDDMLKKMQQQAHDANPGREKAGYPSIEIVGWAAPPRYDKVTHKLYWAKDLKFGGDEGDTLNYDIRVLGRRGVLVLGAISSMNDFPGINQQIPSILSMVDFQAGNTYADFDPKVDKIAEYGLGALVAGGTIAAAAKLGLFGLLLKFAIAGYKFILIGLVAIGAYVKNMMNRFSGKSQTPDHLLPPRNDPP